MTRGPFLILSLCPLAAPLAAEAQPTGKVYRIGFLVMARNPGIESAFPRRDAQLVDPHSMKERWFFTNHTRQPVNDRINYLGG